MFTPTQTTVLVDGVKCDNIRSIKLTRKPGKLLRLVLSINNNTRYLEHYDATMFDASQIDINASDDPKAETCLLVNHVYYEQVIGLDDVVYEQFSYDVTSFVQRVD